MRRMSEVHAAGAVVFRRADGGPEIAVIHRPRYDDWSLPKGKLDKGEDFESAAVREVKEEIGVTGPLGKELGPVRYKDNKGRPKLVRYWLMEATKTPPFEPNHEVDRFEWLTAGPALDRLSYAHDRALVQAALELL